MPDMVPRSPIWLCTRQFTAVRVARPQGLPPSFREVSFSRPPSVKHQHQQRSNSFTDQPKLSSRMSKKCHKQRDTAAIEVCSWLTSSHWAQPSHLACDTRTYHPPGHPMPVGSILQLSTTAFHSQALTLIFKDLDNFICSFLFLSLANTFFHYHRTDWLSDRINNCRSLQ